MTPDTLHNCVALIERNAPLLMRVGDELPKRSVRRLQGPFRPPTPRRTVARMIQLRADGLTIEQVARVARVSWRTAWLHTKVAA